MNSLRPPLLRQVLSAHQVAVDAAITALLALVYGSRSGGAGFRAGHPALGRRGARGAVGDTGRVAAALAACGAGGDRDQCGRDNGAELIAGFRRWPWPS